MAANTGTINITLEVDDKGSVKLSNAALKGISALDGLKVKSGAVARSMKSAFNSVGSTLQSVYHHLATWKGALLAIAGIGGLGAIAKGAVDTASRFEQMRLSLDTITKGAGTTTLNELNNWALKMPVNTEKAVQSFIMMRAMGLDPTIAQMTTLVDTMGALGGNEEMLQGIARALGQMQTKGKVSAEELMQLAERGVPVFQILEEHFGKVDTSTIDAGKAIQAIFAGLEERFGGMSTKQQNSWTGMINTIKSYWTEFQRLIMESTLFEELKTKLASVVEWLDEAKWSGSMEDFAKAIGEKIVSAIKQMDEWVGKVKAGFEDWSPVLEGFWKILKTVLEGLGKVADLYKGTYKFLSDWSSKHTSWQDTVFSWFQSSEPIGQANNTTTVNSSSNQATTVNVNQALSRSDVNNILSELQRNSFRDSNGDLQFNYR